jgi:hypothetical protein
VAADSALSHRIFGTPGAERLVVLVGAGSGAPLDPLPAETAARDICVLAVTLGDATMEDPGGFGSETPAEQTAAWLARLIRQTLVEIDAEGATTTGVVVYGRAVDVALRAVDVALRAVVDLGEEVDRLALINVAAPEQPLDRDDLGALIEGVSAKALIMNGQHVEGAAAAASAWYKDHLGSARVEMVPGVSELSLSAVWARALSHVAPRTKR